MARDISIAISAKDNFTQAITTMRNANSSFNKDLTETSQKISDFGKREDALRENQSKLQSSLVLVTEELKKAKKEFVNTNDEVSKTNYEKVYAEYNKLKDSVKNYGSEIKSTQNQMRSLSQEQSKMENRAGSNSGNGILNGLAQAGITKMVGDSVSQIANTAIGSAFGSNAGTMFGSTLSGAASGAALGTMVAPGIGTVIGAAVGGITGAVNGATQILQNQDDAFKSVVQDNYNSVKQSQSDALSSGSATAAQREQDQISFSTILGGSDKAEKFLSQIRVFGDKTPFEYDDLTKLSKTMLTYGYKQNEIIPQLTKVGDTGSATGMSTDDMNSVITVLGRMKSTGATTMEYLNMLMDRHIPALDYLSEALGKTKAEVKDMVSKGLVPGGEAAKTISDYMGKANKDSMDLQSHSYNGMQSTLEDAQKSVNAALGNGFNDERKLGMQNEINALSGESGKQLEEANTMIGKFQADLLNTQNKLLNDAKTSVVSGTLKGNFSDDNTTRLQQLADDYKAAKAQSSLGDKEAGIKAAQDMAEAEVIAGNEYKASEGYQLQLESDKSLVSGIREDMVKDGIYKQYGYEMGLEFSKGLASTAKPGIESALNPNSYLRINSIGSGNQSSSTNSQSSNANPQVSSYLAQNASGHATGIFRVPYNDFPALLHEGESVSTAVEARSQKNTPTVTITGNSFVVREEADIDKIARALVENMYKASAVS